LAAGGPTQTCWDFFDFAGFRAENRHPLFDNPAMKIAAARGHAGSAFGAKGDAMAKPFSFIMARRRRWLAA
jgi:hypothetical protein